MTDDLSNGDVSATVVRFLKSDGQEGKHFKKEPSSLDVSQVEEFLETLSSKTKEEEQLDCISTFLARATLEDARWIIKLIDKDLRINIGPKYVLDALHPKLYKAFKNSNNLKLIIERYLTRELDLIQGITRTESITTSISLMNPIKPMVAK